MTHPCVTYCNFPLKVFSETAETVIIIIITVMLESSSCSAKPVVLYLRGIQVTAVMEKGTEAEDMVISGVEDMPVAAVMIVMSVKGVHLPTNCTCHLGILSDVRGEGNECIRLEQAYNTQLYCCQNKYSF